MRVEYPIKSGTSGRRNSRSYSDEQKCSEAPDFAGESRRNRFSSAYSGLYIDHTRHQARQEDIAGFFEEGVL